MVSDDGMDDGNYHLDASNDGTIDNPSRNFCAEMIMLPAVCQGERAFALRFSLVNLPSGVELWILHAVLELAIALKGRNSDALQTSYLEGRN